DGWKYEFTNLPKYENGQEIVYTITEDQVPDYNTEIHGFDITNSYTPGKTSVSVTKAWNDQNNQDGLRPNSV
ncbi:Cna B-type domain-containing protein, partial [Enterococcus gallinarum]|uniref:Cna B-type domain-containing protein n=1 Tax=Enterococcus gallinarum TaxID=1353 RepID=UPI001D17329A